jgi:hypothetical protein
MNVQMKVHKLRSFITHLLVHIHQKKKIVLEIAAKICKCKRVFTCIINNEFVYNEFVLKKKEHVYTFSKISNCICLSDPCIVVVFEELVRDSFPKLPNLPCTCTNTSSSRRLCRIFKFY